jgi:hypothetical protein
MAYVISPKGVPGVVPDADLSRALAQGYKQREPTAQETARTEASGDSFQTGAEAAVRTALPFGLGQGIVTGFESEFSGKDEKQVLEEQRLRGEANPVAKVIGTGVGFIGPSKVLRGATGVANTLRGMATIGALEGTALGVTEAVNESILEDKPLTAENLAATALASAGTGALFDFGTGAVSKGVSSLIKRAGGSSLAEALKDAGTKTSLGMLETKKWARRFGAAEDDIARVAREEGVLSRATALDDASVTTAQAARERVGQQVADALDSAQYLQAPSQDAMFNAVSAAVKPFERNPLAREALRDVKSAADQLYGQGASWKEMWDVQRGWGQKRGASVRAEVFDAASRAMREFVMDSAPKQVGGLGKSLRDLSSRYASLEAFAAGLEEAALQYRVGSTPLRDAAVAGGSPGGGA